MKVSWAPSGTRQAPVRSGDNPDVLSRIMALHALQDLTPGEFMDWALNIKEGCGSSSCARAGLIWFPKGESKPVDIACKQLFFDPKLGWMNED